MYVGFVLCSPIIFFYDEPDIGILEQKRESVTGAYIGTLETNYLMGAR